MYTFKKTLDRDNHFDNTEITHTTDTVCLQELLESFEYFLRGAGFSFKGHVEIVEEELTDDE